MAGNKLNKHDRGTEFQRRFNERYRENVFDKLPKRPFFLFLEILVTKIGRLILLNLMYCVFFGPYIISLAMVLKSYNDNNLNNMILFTLLYIAIGIFYGPATAGFTFIMRKTIADETVFLVNDFMEQLKKNFKQGVFMGLFDSIFFFGVMVYAEFIINLYFSGSSIPLLNGMMIGLICLVIVIYYTMRYYIYMMMVSIDLKITDMMRNALAFVFIGAPTNLLVMVVFTGLLVASFVLIPYSIIVILVFGISFVGLMINFNAYAKIKKHLINPILDTSEKTESEKIFSDEPVVPGKADKTTENPALSAPESKPNSDSEPKE